MKKLNQLITAGFVLLGISVFAQGNAGNLQVPANPEPNQANTQWANQQKGYKPNIHALHRAMGGISVLDSICQWNWDTNTVLWDAHVDFRYIDYLYDANYNDTVYIDQTWSGSNWVNDEQYHNMYDAHNNQTGQVYQLWVGSAWKNETRNMCTYNAGNRQTGIVNENWSGSAWVPVDTEAHGFDAHNNNTYYLYEVWFGSSWGPNYQLFNTYNANNSRTAYLGQNWSGVWVNSDSGNYVFDIHNNQIADTTYTWGGAAWAYNELQKWTYNAGNYILTEVDKNWSGSAWVNLDSTFYNYDSHNNDTCETTLSWSGSAWVNNIKYSNAYNVSNQAIRKTTLSWNGSAWVNKMQDLYTWGVTYYATDLTQAWSGSAWTDSLWQTFTYDVNSNNLSATYRNFNHPGTKYKSGDSMYYYYRYVTLGINSIPAQNADIRIYPNPSNGKFTVQWAAISVPATVEVYNMLGEKLKSFQLSLQNNQIDLSSQTNGIYLYRVISDAGELIGQGKLMIQK